MKRVFIIAFLCLLTMLVIGQSAFSQQLQQQPAPTLVPPTLVPTQDAGIFDTIPSESGIARIVRDGVVRVGILYNEVPFSVLNIRNEIAGADADLARSMAEQWGVEVQFVQVTRQTAVDMLRSDQVDMLLAAMVHRRELDSLVEFSQSYVISSQSMMVRVDDAAQTLADMATRRVGVVVGTSSESAVSTWLARTGTVATVQTYLTLSQAVTALLTNEVDGVVSTRTRLLRSVSQPETVRILDEPVSPEPYAVAVRRQDVNLRNLVNRTLQFLSRSGRIHEIHDANMPEVPFREDTLPIWANLGDEAPRPDQFPTDITYPQQYVLPRVMNDRVVRVAGALDGDTTTTSVSVQSLDRINRQIIETMASRWGVTVEYVAGSASNPLEFVANGQADIAIGVQADWSWVDRVDFTQGYFMRGYRLMVEQNSDVTGFETLRSNPYVATDINDPNAITLLQDEAEEANVRVQTFQADDAAYSMLVDNNADLAFGDSLWLLPQIAANSGLVRLTDEWYAQSFLSMAVVRNDIDFRLLVEYTLQDISQDGTLTSLLRDVMPVGESFTLQQWPGSSG